MRAVKRQRSFGTFELVPANEGPGLLEDMSILAVTCDEYLNRLLEFDAFRRRYGLLSDDPVKIDIALRNFMDFRFLQGGELSDGHRLLVAWAWAHPTFSKHGKYTLVTACRSLQGWKRLAPLKTRAPLPWLFAALSAKQMILLGEPRSALGLMLMFWCYLRPGELLRLRARDGAPPGGGAVFGASISTRASSTSRAKWGCPTKACCSTARTSPGWDR